MSDPEGIVSNPTPLPSAEYSRGVAVVLRRRLRELKIEILETEAELEIAEEFSISKGRE